MYSAFTDRDMEGLLSKLSPLVGGASDGITTLELPPSTMVDTLGVGDLRALLGKLEGRDTA